MRTRIKYCGITRPEDAIFAAELGVDAIGLVFYPDSPRHVTIPQAIDIVSCLPAFVSVVGLFVDEQEAVIKNVLGNVQIDCLQFHGDESPEACRMYNKRYIKAIRMRDNTNVLSLTRRYNDADGLLLDAYHEGTKGGTGSRFDWGLIPEVSMLPIILAGGLQASNVRMAIKDVKPYALDVSSGVESEKGIKDRAKMTAFFNAVRQGDLRTT